MFRWEIEVLEYNTYGDKIVKRTPMSVLAPTKTGVTEKVRAAFEAKYDGFRKFWSHGWTPISVSEPMSGSTDPSADHEDGSAS